MLNSDYFKNKKITVVGLARSGLSCANLLYDLAKDISVTDNRDNQTIRQNASRLKSKEIKLELGRHTKDFIKERDLIVVSPGVQNCASPVLWAEELKIPIVSEIEVAWKLCPGITIAISGSNGKTTVATLIGQMLKKAGKRAFVCGNIGRPFSAEVKKIRKTDFVSLEVSSFQLERIKEFKPKIALLLNFSPNHLDRYRNLKEYLQAKEHIFINQDESDCLVLNYNDPVLRDLVRHRKLKPKIAYFTQTKSLNSNQAAVMAVGSLLGINKRLILSVFREFKGIEHRLEDVAVINNVRFVNDSKSTTVDSTVWALRNINNRIVLIAGGKDKGLDYRLIRNLLRKKVREVVLVGEARRRMESVFSGYLPVEGAITLQEAVNKAYLKAGPGDCVLFSPMCSSFDMFTDYEDRGRSFKRAVLKLKKHRHTWFVTSE